MLFVSQYLPFVSLKNQSPNCLVLLMTQVEQWKMKVNLEDATCVFVLN